MLQSSHVKKFATEHSGKYKQDLKEEIVSPLIDATVFLGQATINLNQFKQDMQWSRLPGHGMKRVLRSPPSSLGPLSNSGLQNPPFQPLNITYDPLKQS